MDIKIFDSADELGRKAAQQGAAAIKNAIQEKGSATIILATGNSQLSMLKNLTCSKDIDWSKVHCFHLDEYVGISSNHPASFRKYLKEKFADKVSPLGQFVFVQGDAEDPEQECARLSNIISKYTIDVAFIGIGENAHIAFNDPPADFETDNPYIVVTLDTACRKQQLNEGWFSSLEDVPKQAISMSVKQILKSKKIVCSVPDERKADAVKHTVENEIDNSYPATVLKSHPDCSLYLDKASSSLLSIKS